MMRQAVSSPTPLKKQRRKMVFVRFLIFVLSILVLFVGMGFISRIPALVIHEVRVSGTKVLDTEVVADTVRSYLSSRVALLYVRGNIFLYSQKEISSFIRREFPRVFSVTSIERNHTMLSINIEERQAAFTWCGESPPTYSTRFDKRDCYFLDQEGFVFDHAPYFTPGVYMTLYGGIASPASPIGETIALKNSILDYGVLAEKLANLGLPVHSIVIHTDNQDELILDLPTDIGNFTTIRFNEDSTLSELFSKIDSTIHEASFAAQWKVHPRSLEYIDTRFGNKVFYKFTPAR